MSQLNPIPTAKFIHGKGYSWGISIMLILLGILGIYVLWAGEGIARAAATPFLMIGIMPFFSHWGTELNFERQAIREYNSVLGLQWGNWKTFKFHTDIVVQTLHYKDEVYSSILGMGAGIRNFKVMTLQDRKTKVFFMTPDHRHKFLVATGENAEHAFKIAQELSEKTGKKIKKFSPRMSKESRARRYL